MDERFYQSQAKYNFIFDFVLLPFRVVSNLVYTSTLLVCYFIPKLFPLHFYIGRTLWFNSLNWKILIAINLSAFYGVYFFFSNRDLSVSSVRWADYVWWYLLLGTQLICTISLVKIEFARNRNELLGKINGSSILAWYSKCFRHPEDSIWALTLVKHLFVTVPPTFALYYFPEPAWELYLAYSLNMVTVILYGDWDLMLHLVSHYRAFAKKRENSKLQSFMLHLSEFSVEFIGNFFCLRLPYLMQVTHNAYHHKENNGLEDYETTAIYERSSLSSTLPIFWKNMLAYCFLFPAHIYVSKLGTSKIVKRAFGGLAFTYFTIVALSFINPYAATFILCVRLTLIGMFYGSVAFNTHAFVDPLDPNNLYKNSLDTVSESYIFNLNAAHTVHHIKPSQHWLQTLDFRKEKLPEYISNHTVVVHHDVYPYLFCFLFAKRFEALSALTYTPGEIRNVFENDLYSYPRIKSQKEHVETVDLLRMRSTAVFPVKLNKVERFLDFLVGEVLWFCVPSNLKNINNVVEQTSEITKAA